MKHESCPSFLFSGPSDLDHAKLVSQLDSECNHSPPVKFGCEVWCAAWSFDNTIFAWSKGHRTVQLVPWDASKNAQEKDPKSITRQVVTIDCGELVWSLAFGKGWQCDFSGKISQQKFAQKLILATGLQSGRIKLWDCSTGTVLTELLDHKDVVRDLSFSPAGPLHLASASRDGSVKLWDLTQDGNMYRTIRTPSKMVYGVRWSPNCKMIACVGSNKMVAVYSIDSECCRRLQGHYHDVASCDFSPDGALLATASYDTRIIIWDVYTGTAIKELGHLFPPPRPIYAGGANDHYVRKVSFNSGGFLLSSICDDDFLRVWNLGDEDGEPVAIADVTSAVSCTFSHNGSLVAVGNRTGGVTFHLCPARVPSLQHLCRTTVRALTTPSQVETLPLPSTLKDYLKYLYLAPTD